MLITNKATKEFEHMPNKEEFLKEIVGKSCNVWNQFYVMKTLMNKEYEPLFNHNKYFWGAIQHSLGQSLLVDLAKFFEKSKKVVSIYSVLAFSKDRGKKEKIEKELDENLIVKNLKEWRDNIYMHTNKEVLFDFSTFSDAYPLKYGDLEELLTTIEDLIGSVVSGMEDTGHTYDFRNFKEQSQKDVEEIISILRQNFKL